MPFQKIPLKQLIEANKQEHSIIFGWREFKAIAEQEQRPSYNSLSKIFKKSNNTIKAWLRRYDEGENR